MAERSFLKEVAMLRLGGNEMFHGENILAVSKAWLVALYFMHLKWEKPWLKWIALMPAYMGVATVLLMLETVYR